MRLKFDKSGTIFKGDEGNTCYYRVKVSTASTDLREKEYSLCYLIRKRSFFEENNYLRILNLPPTIVVVLCYSCTKLSKQIFLMLKAAVDQSDLSFHFPEFGRIYVWIARPRKRQFFLFWMLQQLDQSNVLLEQKESGGVPFGSEMAVLTVKSTCKLFATTSQRPLFVEKKI